MSKTVILILLAIIAFLSSIGVYDERGPWNGFGFVLITISAIAAATLIYIFG